MAEREGAAFKEETIAKLLQLHFKDEKIKILSTALTQLTELFRILAQEAALRAAKRAKSEGSKNVTVEHFEKILPQLLLDFC